MRCDKGPLLAVHNFIGISSVYQMGKARTPLYFQCCQSSTIQRHPNGELYTFPYILYYTNMSYIYMESG